MQDTCMYVGLARVMLVGVPNCDCEALTFSASTYRFTEANRWHAELDPSCFIDGKSFDVHWIIRDDHAPAPRNALFIGAGADRRRLIAALIQCGWSSI